MTKKKPDTWTAPEARSARRLAAGAPAEARPVSVTTDNKETGKNTVATRNPETATEPQAPKRGRGRPPKNGSAAMGDAKRSKVARSKRYTEMYQCAMLLEMALKASNSIPGIARGVYAEVLHNTLKAVRRIDTELAEQIGRHIMRLENSGEP